MKKILVTVLVILTLSLGISFAQTTNPTPCVPPTDEQIAKVRAMLMDGMAAALKDPAAIEQWVQSANEEIGTFTVTTFLFGQEVVAPVCIEEDIDGYPVDFWVRMTGTLVDGKKVTIENHRFLLVYVQRSTGILLQAYSFGDSGFEIVEEN